MTTTHLDLKDDLLKRIQGAFSFNDVRDTTRGLEQILGRYTNSILEEGKAASSFIKELSESDEDPSQFEPFHFVYEYMDEVQKYVTLYRDVIHELVKGHVYLLDKRLSEERWQSLKNDSQETLLKATDELYGAYHSIVNSSSAQSSARKFNVWKHQKSPWPVYEQYIETIIKQCSDLCDDNPTLQHSHQGMKTIADWIKGNLNEYGEDIEQSMNLAEEVLTHMASQELSPKRMASFIKSKVDMLASLDRENSFNTHADNIISQLKEKLKVKVDVAGSKLIVKDVYLQRQVKQYIDSEIRPVLYEFWELAHDIQNNLKMAFLNVQNKALLMANEEDEKNWDDELKATGIPLKNFIDNWTNWKIQLKKHRKTIHERLDEDFILSNVYNLQDSFLPIPFQSSINQLRLNQTQFWAAAKNFFKERLKFVDTFRNNVAAEEALSNSEKIVRYIEEGSVANEHQNYAGIFLTKGYLGSSFWVGREAEITRIKNIYERWLHGYRGSVVLTGNRFCGKTLFGEHVCNTHIREEFIRLEPNSSFTLGGRTFSTSTDMAEALAEIKKYSLGLKIIVWIDDIELWSSVKHPLAHNARALTKYIDELSNRIFFIVATTDWVMSLLSELYEFKRVFQARISLRHMDAEEIKRAILIRHGATHKMLVDVDGERLPLHKLQKALNRTVRYVDGNIGDALNYWTSSIVTQSNDHVVIKERKDYRLPEFLRSDISLILKTIILNKKTNEYHLNRLFGEDFSKDFKRITQRLLSVGILERNLDGWLEVNEVVVNEIARRLEDQMFLNRIQ